MNAALSILKKSGKKEEFSKKKLEYSLICAGANREQAQRITEQVYECCHEGVSTKEIFNLAFKLLKKTNKVVATQYSIPKAIHELGPDGFNFEKFIGAIFKAQGFEVTNNNMINGKCVMHEVDVIARKKDQRIYSECKFHNRPGTKNDLKTALYVQARYLDVKANSHNDVTEFWLISNTKFSKDAIQYAECAGLKLLGPNYPSHNALADLAKKTKIHPITSLISLKKNQAKHLLKQGIVLTSEIAENKNKLQGLGLSLEGIEDLFAEIESLRKSE